MSASDRFAPAQRQMANRDDRDDFLGEDIGYPDPRAQKLGFRLLLFFMFVAGLIGLVGGLFQNFHEITSAFPTASSLADGAAWAKFAFGVGRTAVIGLIVLVLALILRWRMRRGR